MEYIAYYSFIGAILCLIGAGRNKTNFQNADAKKWRMFRNGVMVFSLISLIMCFLISRNVLNENAEGAGIFMWIPGFLAVLTAFSYFNKKNFDYTEIIDLEADDYEIDVFTRPYGLNNGLTLILNDGRRIAASGFQVARPVKCRLYVRSFDDPASEVNLYPNCTMVGYEILEPYKTPFAKTAFGILALILLFICPFTLGAVNTFVTCVAAIIFSGLTSLAYGNKFFRIFGMIGTVIFGVSFIASFFML